MVWRRVSIGKLHLQLGLLNNRLLSIDIRNIIVITDITIVIIFIIIVINNHHQCHHQCHYQPQLVTSIAQQPATIYWYPEHHRHHITSITIVIIFILIVINNHHQCHYHGHYQLVTSIAQHPATINWCPQGATAEQHKCDNHKVTNQRSLQEKYIMTQCHDSGWPCGFICGCALSAWTANPV